MEKLTQYAEQKIKLRKTLLIIISACFFLLIYGTLNAVLERSSDNDNFYNQDEFKDIAERKTPREIVMEQRDRDIRMYSTLVIILIIFGASTADFIMVKCPKCGKHIPLGLNPGRCRRCGTSFISNSSEKKK